MRIVEREELAELLDQHSDSIGWGNSRHWYCPNPAHDDSGTPNAYIYERGDHARIKCFACDWTGDYWDLCRLLKIEPSENEGDNGEPSNDAPRDEAIHGGPNKGPSRDPALLGGLGERGTPAAIHGAGNTGDDLDDGPSEPDRLPSGGDRSSTSANGEGGEGEAPSASSASRSNRQHTDISWTEYIQRSEPAYDYWASRGIGESTVAELGLVIGDDSDPVHRNRAVVPFLDGNTVVHITSRAVLEEQEPRWRDAAGPKQVWQSPKCVSSHTIVLTEGPSDAIAVDDCGYASAAILGASAFRPEQVNLFRAKKVLVIGDDDASGLLFSQSVPQMFAKANIASVGVVAAEKDLSWMHERGMLQRWLDEQLANVQWPNPWPHLQEVTLMTQITAPPWLVSNWLPGQGVSMIFGESETGKSWLGEDLAAAVATPGRQWLGEEIKVHGPSIIMDWENQPVQIQSRIVALGIESNPDFHWLHLTDSLDEESFKEEVLAYVTDVRPSFIFFDSLSRSFSSLQENSSSSVNGAMTTYMRICQKADCAGLVLHHENKPAAFDRGSWKNRARGDTSIINATEAAWRALGSHDERKLFIVKMRNAPQTHGIGWELKSDPSTKRIRVHRMRTL